MRIRVAFNATPLLSTVTGIANYIAELGAALAELPDVDPYSFYRHRWRHESPTLRSPDAARRGKSMAERIKPLVPFRGMLRSAGKHFGFRAGLRRFKIDLYHEQNYIPLCYDVPVVVTIHDLSWIRYPESHPIDRVRWLERGLEKALDRARAILVDSEFVRREVLATFGLDTERVHMAHLGVPRGFHPRDAVETAATLGPLGLRHGGYVLSVATIEPRKNLGHLIDAYSQLPSAVRDRFPLVIAGAKGWHSSVIESRLRGLNERQARFLGQVERPMLTHLYAGAALFAFPSLYEGFGLPPLEAMASGVPVIVSDRASLPEVVGDVGQMIDPSDTAATAAHLEAVLGDPARRDAMAARGLERAASFTWAKCARITHAVYRYALHDEPAWSPDSGLSTEAYGAPEIS